MSYVLSSESIHAKVYIVVPTCSKQRPNLLWTMLYLIYSEKIITKKTKELCVDASRLVLTCSPPNIKDIEITHFYDA